MADGTGGGVADRTGLEISPRLLPSLIHLETMRFLRVFHPSLFPNPSRNHPEGDFYVTVYVTVGASDIGMSLGASGQMRQSTRRVATTTQ